MAEIPLHGKNAKGRVTLVDDADLDVVQRYRWGVMEKARPSGTTIGPYAVATVPRAGEAPGTSICTGC